MVSAQDDELSAIRAQRLKAIQEQAQQQAVSQLEAEEKAHEAAQTAAQIDSTLRVAMTPDARSRLARIALVDPTRATSIKTSIAAMYQSGQLNQPMSDASLKQMLSSQSKSRNNASIRRI
ncbi:DNA-binding protein [Candidatus Poseidonia alphae]|nr:DNA-binding protein [Candidatus Poseidonia alphae]MDA9168165.1 DNA-binding protein [Candidatus Poseidonia alphae]